jgi:hypothetical protein
VIASFLVFKNDSNLVFNVLTVIFLQKGEEKNILIDVVAIVADPGSSPFLTPWILLHEIIRS